jgi:DNA-directed RNA polymerase subunit RPC12/RpoP
MCVKITHIKGNMSIKRCPACGAQINIPMNIHTGDQVTCRYCDSRFEYNPQAFAVHGQGERTSFSLKGTAWTLIISHKRESLMAVIVVSLFLAILFKLSFPKKEREPEILSTGYKDSVQTNQSERTRASVSGKYSELIQVLHCPRDKATYGEFSDYGWWGGGQWCGSSVKAGYWVWVPPNWYVWKNKSRN